MIYLLAIIGIVTLAVLFWRAFGPDLRASGPDRVVGPDDDPEFLWQIDRNTRRGEGPETTGSDNP